MKRIVFALALFGCLLSLTPRADAAAEVSLNFFYDNLSPYGNWIEVDDYGYCFQPSVGVNDSSWRPYADGYWAYTEVGWTWVSYEDFGWATYHYGRWTNLADYGWVWVPGYEWGPAWVSWRTGGDYIGWAPLPPAGEVVYEGRPITSHVDVEFDIGPLFYNFVDIRYIGEPVLRQRLIAPVQNVTIINRTVNVTNITYINSTVYNYGPDFNRVNQFSSRPVQRLAIQRETNVGNFQPGHGNLNRVNGNQLMVVAPPIQRSAQPVAPKQVKAKVPQPRVERGWQGVSNREQIQAQMKKENPKNVSAPTFQPNRRAIAGEAVTPPGGNAAQAESAREQQQRIPLPGQRRSGEAKKQPSTNQDQDLPTAGINQPTSQGQDAQRENQRQQGQQAQQSRPNQPADQGENAQGENPRRQGQQAQQHRPGQQPQPIQPNRAYPPRPEGPQPQRPPHPQGQNVRPQQQSPQPQGPDGQDGERKGKKKPNDNQPQPTP